MALSSDGVKMTGMNSLSSTQCRNAPEQQGGVRRIALVTETWPPEVNGVAMTTARMLEGLAGYHDVELVRVRQSGTDAPPVGADYDSLLMPGIGLPNYSGLRMGLPVTRQLTRHWRRYRPDLVHVVTEGPLGWSAVRAARRLGIPVSSDFHTNFHNYSCHYGIRIMQRPVLGYLRNLHNRTSVTLVPTRALADDLARKGFERLRIVARGVDTGLFHPKRRNEVLRREWGVSDQDTPVIMMVSRIAPEKNFPLAIRAFRAIQQVVPKARMVIVGDGPQRKALAAANPDIHFAGMRQGEVLADYYASADLFVFSSLSETFGNVTLEAMASGLAVIAYNYAAAREHIQHGIDGLVAEPGAEESFIHLAVRVATDHALRNQLGSMARKTAEGLGWEHICCEFEKALLESLEVGSELD